MLWLKKRLFHLLKINAFFQAERADDECLHLLSPDVWYFATPSTIGANSTQAKDFTSV
jgi:hypothetical protein